jgi:hypothetical protein
MPTRSAILVWVWLPKNRELFHLDGHFGNIRADNNRLYLVDFGLATSPRFDLSDAERDFATRNAGHDADYASMRLVNWLVTSVCGVPCRPTAVQSPGTSSCADVRPATSRRTRRRRPSRGSSPDMPPPPHE